MLRSRLNNFVDPVDPVDRPPHHVNAPQASQPVEPGAPVEACLEFRTRPLPEMEPMQVAVVEDVTGDAEDIGRLKSMGLCAGRRLQLVKRGDPLVVRVLGSRIGISRRLAEHVAVRPCRLSGE